MKDNFLNLVFNIHLFFSVSINKISKKNQKNIDNFFLTKENIKNL